MHADLLWKSNEPLGSITVPLMKNGSGLDRQYVNDRERRIDRKWDEKEPKAEIGCARK
jgi:hypothetical protein